MAKCIPFIDARPKFYFFVIFLKFVLVVVQTWDLLFYAKFLPLFTSIYSQAGEVG